MSALTEAGRLLAELGRSPMRGTVVVDLPGGVRLEYRPPPGEPPAGAADLPGGALWVTPEQEEIVRALAGRGWTVCAEVARLLGREPGTEFRFLLRILAERKILESCQRRGYRLAGGDDGAAG